MGCRGKTWPELGWPFPPASFREFGRLEKVSDGYRSYRSVEQVSGMWLVVVCYSFALPSAPFEMVSYYDHVIRKGPIRTKSPLKRSAHESSVGQDDFLAGMGAHCIDCSRVLQVAQAQSAGRALAFTAVNLF